MIFADEPTGALNSENSTAVLDVLTKLNENKQSIIMVTHDKKSALRGNRIIYLKDGKIYGELKLDKYKKNDNERKSVIMYTYFIINFSPFAITITDSFYLCKKWIFKI